MTSLIMTHYDVIIWVLFYDDFSKKPFKSGFVPIEKIFLLFLVIVFFSETSFQLLTKEKADLSETKWTHELNPYTCISNRHCWYQIFKIQKNFVSKIGKIRLLRNHGDGSENLNSENMIWIVALEIAWIFCQQSLIQGKMSATAATTFHFLQFSI